MHPFAIFPELLTFQIVSPFLLRISVGLFIVYLGWRRSKKPYNFTAIFYVASGVLLVLGLYTQITALAAIVILKLDFYWDYWTNRKTVPIPENQKILFGVFIVILISLLLTGPGFLAFDLPL